MQSRSRLQGHLFALVTILVWGTTFISTKVLLVEFSPVEIMFFRLALAYLALLAASPRFLPVRSLGEELRFMAAGLTGVTLYFIFQNTALSYTLASNVGVLVSVAPFFVALASAVFLRDERLHRNFFIGFLLSITGIILISFNGNFILKLNPLGDVLSILCAVVWAFYCVVMKKLDASSGYTVLQYTRKIFLYGLLFLLPILGLFNFRLGPERLTSLPNILNLLFLGVGASAICFVTWNSAVRILGAVRTSVYIYLVPIITIASSALVLHERITPVALGGVGLILLGLFLSERRSARQSV